MPNMANLGQQLEDDLLQVAHSLPQRIAEKSTTEDRLYVEAFTSKMNKTLPALLDSLRTNTQAPPYKLVITPDAASEKISCRIASISEAPLANDPGQASDKIYQRKLDMLGVVGLMVGMRDLDDIFQLRPGVDPNDKEAMLNCYLSNIQVYLESKKNEGLLGERDQQAQKFLQQFAAYLITLPKDKKQPEQEDAALFMACKEVHDLKYALNELYKVDANRRNDMSAYIKADSAIGRVYQNPYKRIAEYNFLLDNPLSSPAQTPSAANTEKDAHVKYEAKNLAAREEAIALRFALIKTAERIIMSPEFEKMYLAFMDSTYHGSQLARMVKEATPAQFNGAMDRRAMETVVTNPAQLAGRYVILLTAIVKHTDGTDKELLTAAWQRTERYTAQLNEQQRVKEAFITWAGKNEARKKIIDELFIAVGKEPDERGKLRALSAFMKNSLMMAKLFSTVSSHHEIAAFHELISGYAVLLEASKTEKILPMQVAVDSARTALRDLVRDYTSEGERIADQAYQNSPQDEASRQALNERKQKLEGMRDVVNDMKIKLDAMTTYQEQIAFLNDKKELLKEIPGYKEQIEKIQGLLQAVDQAVRDIAKSTVQPTVQADASPVMGPRELKRKGSAPVAPKERFSSLGAQARRLSSSAIVSDRLQNNPPSSSPSTPEVKPSPEVAATSAQPPVPDDKFGPKPTRKVPPPLTRSAPASTPADKEAPLSPKSGGFKPGR